MTVRLQRLHVVACAVDADFAPGDGHQRVALQACDVVADKRDADAAALHNELAIAFAAVELGFGLDAIASDALDDHVAAFLLIVLSGMDAIAQGTRDADGARGLLQFNIFLRADGVLHVSLYGKRTAATHLEMALAIESSLLRTSSIDERIGCAFSQLQADALAVLNVDGGSLLIGQRKALQNDGRLVGALIDERAIGTSAAQRRDVLVGGVRIDDSHCRTLDSDCHIGNPCLRHSKGSPVGCVVDKQRIDIFGDDFSG